VSKPVGTFCLVLHSHLPWLTHHGAWPVGEEWVHQAWADTYIPVAAVLQRLADRGHQHLLTLGITPVLHAQLDDPYMAREHATWLAGWENRVQGAAARPVPLTTASYEAQLARTTQELFAEHWAHGASPVLRGLHDSGVIELLGGPATHPFLPLCRDQVARLQVRTGLDDHQLRLGHRPTGVWTPECAMAPGVETLWAEAGVDHLVLDGPALHGDTHEAVLLGDSDVVAFPRDLEVTYRVWSPKAGYPGNRWYRDFHSYDHPSGLRPYRVTSHGDEPKKAYEPDAARAQVERDAVDFVQTVVKRLESNPLVVAAYDTELLGHWWHEGPQWLERVLELLIEAGVNVTTLERAMETHVGRRVETPVTSWGKGKDWHIWTGEPVADVVLRNAELERRLVDVARKVDARVRNDALDQLAREVLLATASDWAFLVSHDGAGGYARERLDHHEHAAHRLADALESGHRPKALALARQLRASDGLFGHLDARHLAG
jgi:1,4-alpha-glucan branching enzyme